MTPAALDLDDLATVSPLVADVASDLFAAHPSLSKVAEVQLAILGITSRYIAQLRGLDVQRSRVSDSEVRRAFLFLENTARPVLDVSETTAADLVNAARRAIASRRNAETNVVEFERAIAAIVQGVRGELARRVSRSRPTYAFEG